MNSIRPAVVASLLGKGEAQLTHGPKRAATAGWSGKPDRENPRSLSGRRGVVGGGMIGRFGDQTQGDLDGAKVGMHALRGAKAPAVQESEHP